MFASATFHRCCQLVVVLIAIAWAAQLRAQDGNSKPLEDEIGSRYYIWQNEEVPGIFVPSGWMPDGEGLSQATSEKESPHSGPHCVRLYCQLTRKPWVGIYFLLAGEWEPQEPFNLFDALEAEKGDAIKCRFWARSADEAVVQFKIGGVTKGKIKDSLIFPVATKWIKLGPEWKMYEVDITGKDVRSLVGGFMWVCDRQHNKARDLSFDLDDIYFVKVKNSFKKP